MPADAEASAEAEPSSDAKGRELRDRANDAYIRGGYEEALELLEQANAVAPYDLHEFNLGAVHDRMGHCEQARDHFEMYLLRAPERDTPAEQQARHALTELYAICGRSQRSADLAWPPKAPEHEPNDPGLPVIPALPVGSPEGSAAKPFAAGDLDLSTRRSFSQRELGLCLLGAGAAAGLGSAISAVLVRRAEHDIEALARRAGAAGSAVSAREVDALEGNGQRYQSLSLGLGVASALLAGTGAMLFVLDRTQESAVEIAADGRLGLAYRRRF